MAEEPKERKAFEAHMRVGGYSNHDKHPDGSYVSSAMELWWQGWKARAQLPSQGGEAVAWLYTGDYLRSTSYGEYRFSGIQIEEWGTYRCVHLEPDRNINGGKIRNAHVTPLYTHPADQVAEGVVVSRELLDQITVELEHDNDRYFLGRGLRALLNGGRS